MTMQLKEVLAALEGRGSKAGIASFSRFGITVSKAYGVAMKDIQAIAKKAGRDHALAQKLWASGWYEARLAAAYIADPAVLTKKEMNAWTADFDNWGVCDTLCFVLFDRSPHAYDRAAQWAKSPKEFIKRAGFALMASLAGHDKAAPPEKFLAFLPMIEEGARDDRNFVKKGVSWALRRIGIRSELVLRKAAMASAKRLAASETACARWVGKDALREFAKAEARRK